MDRDDSTSSGDRARDNARTARFIAELTEAHDKLEAFRQDPDGVMEAAGVPRHHREALKSGDPDQVKAHLGDDSPPGCLVFLT